MALYCRRTPKELAENEKLKAELAELQKRMEEEIEARCEEEKAMEEFHDCQTQEDWARNHSLESQLAAKQMELTNLHMALEDAGLTQ